jgi:hypothetical protein
MSCSGGNSCRTSSFGPAGPEHSRHGSRLCGSFGTIPDDYVLCPRRHPGRHDQGVPTNRKETP